MDLDLKNLAIIRDATGVLIDHGSGHDRMSFEADRKTRSAVLFEIVIQGEGVKRLSPASGTGTRPSPGPRSPECGIGSCTRSTRSTSTSSGGSPGPLLPASSLDLDQIIAQESNP